MQRIHRTVTGDRFAKAPTVPGYVPFFVAATYDGGTWSVTFSYRPVA